MSLSINDSASGRVLFLARAEAVATRTDRAFSSQSVSSLKSSWYVEPVLSCSDWYLFCWLLYHAYWLLCYKFQLVVPVFIIPFFDDFLDYMSWKIQSSAEISSVLQIW